jgi:hypothetical protein
MKREICGPLAEKPIGRSDVTMFCYHRASFPSMTLFYMIACRDIHAFIMNPQQHGCWMHRFGTTHAVSSSLAVLMHHNSHIPYDPCSEDCSSDHRRRDLIKLTLTSLIGTAALSSFAMTTVASETVSATVEMKTFIDPQGLFALKIPKRFFAIRRTSKGDLPDESTGSGRRGSSIFNAGDLAKAEVLAIERYGCLSRICIFSQYERRRTLLLTNLSQYFVSITQKFAV